MRGFLIASLSVLITTSSLADNEVNVWQQATLDAIKTQPFTPPPKASRIMAMVSAAVYDAVNAIDQTHESYIFSGKANSDTSREAATIEAAYQTLKHEFPSLSANFQTLRDQRLGLLSDTTAKSNGIILGATVANGMIANRANDLSDAVADPYLGSNEPGKWRPTPSGFQPGLLPRWGEVKTFGLNTNTQFGVKAPPALNSQEYTEAFNRVKSLGAATGSTRTQFQTDTALFWADGGGTSTPPGHWNRIAQGLVNSRGLSVSDAARLFALLNLAEADSAITCWKAKYDHSFWRPVTAIREAGFDGNPDTIEDPSWMPLLATPPFPSYVSGHSTFSAAAARIMTGFFGTDQVSFTTSAEGFGVPDRTYGSFSEAANEAALSRLYGGIHFDFDNNEGMSLGSNIGDYIYGRYFHPVPEPATLVFVLPLLLTFKNRRKTCSK